MSDVEILETQCLSSECRVGGGEDRLVVAGNCVAVVDGETRKTGGDHGGPDPGATAADILAQGIADLPIDIDLMSACARLSSEIPKRDEGSQQPAAVAAIIHVPSRRVWQVGDVAVGINGTFDVPKKRLDIIAAEARAALLRALLDAGDDLDNPEIDPGREMVLPLLRAAWTYRNLAGHPWGFAAFDGGPIPAEFTREFILPDDPCEVVLASDGYVEPAPTLGESERRLAALLSDDPLRIKSPPGLKRAKPGGSFDDRSYLRVRI